MRAEVRSQKSEVSQPRASVHRSERTPQATLATSHHRSRDRAARRGFSLVEMMVVVGIVVLLFALTIGVLTVLSRSAESRTTKDALSILDQAYEEWKRNSERDVTYGKADEPGPGMVYEIDQGNLPDTPPGTGDDHEPTDELIDIIHRNSQIREILAKINPDLMKPPTPAHDDIQMVDAWDTEIITVHPGRQWVAADQPIYGAKDVDGTIRTEFENVFGECSQRRVRFVSAGPDAQCGDLSAANGTPAREAAKDNIYSYPLENP